MAGTISMAGLASGMDVNGMIDALVKANGAQMNVMQSRVTATKAASTDISNIASLLGKLKTSVDALSDSTTLQSFTATSSSSSVDATVTGAASSGRYSVAVTSLAQEYRSYSDAAATSSTALGKSGAMTIKVGTQSEASINIVASDTLDTLVSKINEAGIGVQANTFNDGTQVRLLLRGTSTGDGNDITVTGSSTGLDLGLNANVKQHAQSAQLLVDGFAVSSQTNTISGAIPGVTLNAGSLTSTAATIEIAVDPSSISSKLENMVSAYNAVVTKVHTVAGYGTTAASNDMLAGDSTLRNLTMKMSNTLLTTVGSDSKYQTLSSLGVSLNRDGTLTLDDTKLTKALSANPTAVTNVLAGSTTSDGVMDAMSDVANMFTRVGDGLLTNKTATYDKNVKRLQEQADAEQSRLDNYRTLLEKQFQAMDDAMTAANSTSAYLTATFGTSSSSSSG